MTGVTNRSLNHKTLIQRALFIVVPPLLFSSCGFSRGCPYQPTIEAKYTMFVKEGKDWDFARKASYVVGDSFEYSASPLGFGSGFSGAVYHLNLGDGCILKKTFDNKSYDAKITFSYPKAGRYRQEHFVTYGESKKTAIFYRFIDIKAKMAKKAK